MFPTNARFAVLALLTAIMTGCSTIGSLAGANTDGYGPLVNQAIPGNALHVYQLPRPTSNIGRTPSMTRRAEEARVEKISNVFAAIGIALAFLPSMGASPAVPLFLVCSASLAGNQTADWWSNTSLQPRSLMAGVADRKYCFTENGLVHVR